MPDDSSGSVKVQQFGSRVHLVTLTGSTQVGIETARLAAENLTQPSNWGGKWRFHPAYDCDVDLAVEEMVLGRMYNTGQVCCASKRFPGT